jgi:hypothetical protein
MARRVGFDKHERRMLAVYKDRSAWGREVLMVDNAMNMLHWRCHSSNESLYSSKSKGGGVPYGMNALGGMVAVTLKWTDANTGFDMLETGWQSNKDAPIA